MSSLSWYRHRERNCVRSHRTKALELTQWMSAKCQMHWMLTLRCVHCVNTVKAHQDFLSITYKGCSIFVVVNFVVLKASSYWWDDESNKGDNEKREGVHLCFVIIFSQSFPALICHYSIHIICSSGFSSHAASTHTHEYKTQHIRFQLICCNMMRKWCIKPAG